MTQTLDYQDNIAVDYSAILDDEEQFLPIVEKALNSIFSQFDIDNDDALNLDELNAFAKHTNGSILDEDSIEQIQENFDLNENRHLTRSGFFEMMHLQTLAEPKETLKDLEKFGFNFEKKEIV